MGKLGKRIMKKSKRPKKPPCHAKGEYNIGCESCEWYWEQRNHPWWVKQDKLCFPKWAP